MKSSRRNFLTRSAVLGYGAALAAHGIHAHPLFAAEAPSISIFSKHLQWLGFADMARFVKDLGFTGIELTVRPGGHIEPANVVAELPKAAKAARDAGVSIPMLVTTINDATEPYTEDIIRTAAEQGVGSYRMDWFKYDKQYSIDHNINRFIERFRGLEKLNRKYNVRGEYQNHQGQFFGSAVWDLWMAVKSFDPRYIAIQFDAYHAAVEGFNTWPSEFNMVKSHIGSLAIKDLAWEQTDKGWKPVVVPFATGAVDYVKFFGLVNKAQLRCPYTIHYEYPLGGIENGSKKLESPREQVFSAMKRDLDKFKSMMG